MLVYAALLIGCALLYFGGDWLLKGVTSLGDKLGWPKAITGLLLVSLGTSAPELFVSLGSALQAHGGLAAGNVVGSNIINTAIVLGLAASVTVLHVERVLKIQLLFMFALTIVGALMLSDGTVSRLEGLSLLGITVVSFAIAFKPSTQAQINVSGSDVRNVAVVAPPASDEASLSHHSAAYYTIAGIIALLVGAEALIWSGLSLATQFGLPEAVIALTVTALGTSLPEIAATLVAVVKRETSLAVGNVIGSNLLNIGLVLGLSALVRPLTDFSLDNLTIGVFVLLALVITLLGWKPGHYPKLLGPLLMSTYFVYTVMLLS